MRAQISRCVLYLYRVRWNSSIQTERIFYLSSNVEYNHIDSCLGIWDLLHNSVFFNPGNISMITLFALAPWYQ